MPMRTTTIGAAIGYVAALVFAVAGICFIVAAARRGEPPEEDSPQQPQEYDTVDPTADFSRTGTVDIGYTQDVDQSHDQEIVLWMSRPVSGEVDLQQMFLGFAGKYDIVARDRDHTFRSGSLSPPGTLAPGASHVPLASFEALEAGRYRLRVKVVSEAFGLRGIDQKLQTRNRPGGTGSLASGTMGAIGAACLVVGCIVGLIVLVTTRRGATATAGEGDASGTE